MQPIAMVTKGILTASCEDPYGSDTLSGVIDEVDEISGTVDEIEEISGTIEECDA